MIIAKRALSSRVLLSTAFFPPIEYFAVLAKYSVLYMESHENYIKQTYRNRCRILTSNGVEDIRVPVVHNGARLITQVEVDYSTDWVRRAEYALSSAYDSSPFFEYYKDELFSILDSHPGTLWELNGRIIEFFCRKIGLLPKILQTDRFELPCGQPEDFRYTIAPKVPSSYAACEYYQVFREKFGFVGGLSIADLLFNEGPESIIFLNARNSR